VLGRLHAPFGTKGKRSGADLSVGAGELPGLGRGLDTGMRQCRAARPVHVLIRHLGDLGDVEVMERCPEAVSLAEDDRPAQPGLEHSSTRNWSGSTPRSATKRWPA
jgi:hypothetical protein